MTYKTEVLGLPIEVKIDRMGADWLVSVSGGCRFHIGSISTARWNGTEAILTKCVLGEHRDDVVGDKYALELCNAVKSTVCVVCGIHYDSPGPEGIKKIVAAADALLGKIVAELAAL